MLQSACVCGPIPFACGRPSVDRCKLIPLAAATMALDTTNSALAGLHDVMF